MMCRKNPRLKERKELSIKTNAPKSFYSPLRYPGGKTAIAPFVADLVRATEKQHITYVEPYAGGAGVGLYLLLNGLVEQIVINDKNQDVFAFWDSLTNRPDDFLELFDSVEPTMNEWYRQKEILKSPSNMLERGFAFFFLNRTNRSGVTSGGVIGGLQQQGKYRVNSRYYKETIRERLEEIIEKRSQIVALAHDGRVLIESYATASEVFIFADPPYVSKGKSLYLNSFCETDHRELADVMKNNSSTYWVLTYDDAELIHGLYGNQFGGLYKLGYSAFSRKEGQELLMISDGLASVVSLG